MSAQLGAAGFFVFTLSHAMTGCLTESRMFCPALGISIPVGKDSLSMRTAWDGKEVVSPLSLIVSAFAPMEDARAVLTPQLRTDCGETELVLVDLGEGKNRLGGSILAPGSNWRPMPPR